MNALDVGGLAIVTGAASGIGLAAARRLAGMGLRVAMLDRDQEALAAARAAVGGDASVHAVDVADRVAMHRLREAIAEQHGTASFVMNNAGVGHGGDAFADAARWDAVLGVNLFGVLNGVQAFVPAMVDGDAPGIVVNTGSKQGITQPPGDTAYNVSKSAVKALTEGLAHSLRERTGDRVTAHLLIPGFTHTGMTAGGSGDKPDAAWSADQVVDAMFDGIAAGDFYLLCPDNETTRDMDARRIAWAAGDVTENRPALSRWHPDWKDAFVRHMAE